MSWPGETPEPAEEENLGGIGSFILYLFGMVVTLFGLLILLEDQAWGVGTMILGLILYAVGSDCKLVKHTLGGTLTLVYAFAVLIVAFGVAQYHTEQVCHVAGAIVTFLVIVVMASTEFDHRRVNVAVKNQDHATLIQTLEDESKVSYERKAAAQGLVTLGISSTEVINALQFGLISEEKDVSEGSAKALTTLVPTDQMRERTKLILHSREAIAKQYEKDKLVGYSFSQSLEHFLERQREALAMAAPGIPPQAPQGAPPIAAPPPVAPPPPPRPESQLPPQPPSGRSYQFDEEQEVYDVVEGSYEDSYENDTGSYGKKKGPFG